jgi:hypothetical protein
MNFPMITSNDDKPSKMFQAQSVTSQNTTDLSRQYSPVEVVSRLKLDDMVIGVRFGARKSSDLGLSEPPIH